MNVEQRQYLYYLIDLDTRGVHRDHMRNLLYKNVNYSTEVLYQHLHNNYHSTMTIKEFIREQKINSIL